MTFSRLGTSPTCYCPALIHSRRAQLSKPVRLNTGYADQPISAAGSGRPFAARFVGSAKSVHPMWSGGSRNWKYAGRHRDWPRSTSFWKYLPPKNHPGSPPALWRQLPSCSSQATGHSPLETCCLASIRARPSVRPLMLRRQRRRCRQRCCRRRRRHQRCCRPQRRLRCRQHLSRPLRKLLRRHLPPHLPGPHPPLHRSRLHLPRAASATGAPKVELAADTVDVPAGQPAAEVTVRRKGNLRGETSFTWWTESGTAKPGADFSAVVPQLAYFENGKSTVFLSIPLRNARHAQSKSFYVVIEQSPGGAPLGSRTLTLVTLMPSD